MSYRDAGEMASLGQRIVSAAIQAVLHNHSATIDSYSGKAEIDQINNEYADVPRLLASYGQTDPANCQAAVDELYNVADNIDPAKSVTLSSGNLNTGKHLLSPFPKNSGGWTDSLSVTERLKDIDANLTEWHGEARSQFELSFVDHLATAFPLQAALARSLGLILQAHQEIRARANADVWEIGEKSLHALKLQMAMCSCTPSTITATVSVGSAAAAVLTAGGALAVTMAAFSFANALGSAGIAASSAAKMKISGGTPLAILGNMRAAITRVEQKINEQVGGLARLTNTLADNVRSVGDRMEIPSPNAAPGFKAAIRHPNNPGGFYPTDS